MTSLKNLVLIFFIICFFYFPQQIFAQDNSQFITIVNPVRISGYTKDIKETLQSQYAIVRQNSLPATWLLTYDILINERAVSVLKSMDGRQELGLFLEITPQFAEDAGVSYNNTGFWYHATSVFLSGYKQNDRKLLIDKLFGSFHDVFGYYPSSVGSWWTDSYSLAYMKQKYNISANLGCSDQFATDGYQIWGQYWSTPFYPSKFHAGIPASDKDVKLDLVTIQWASRDPLNGYKSSLYSTQDYFVSGIQLDTNYFEKLINLYAKKNNNQFGQITIGLEGDFEAETYKGEYKKQLEIVSKLVSLNEVEAVTMSEFSQWYRNKFPFLSPPQIITSDDLLGKPGKVIWYQSPNYRIGVSIDEGKDSIKIFDFRSYHSDFQEPYYLSPNKEFELSIYIPSYFDEINNKDDIWRIEAGKFIKMIKQEESLLIYFKSGEKITFNPEGIVFEINKLVVPKILQESKALSIKKTNSQVKIIPQKDWLIGRNGLVIRELTDIATHHLARKRTTALILSSFLLVIAVGLSIRFSHLSERIKLILLAIILFPLLSYSFFWYQKNLTNYYISQAEMDALFRLSVLPEGKVMVYDHECLGCFWNTEEKPAVFANKRNYVKKIGKHPIVYTSKVFEAKNQKEAESEFDKLNADYIYIVKYEDYIEKIPFSPGDLDIEKIYDNANAEIWVRDKD